jgi:hypothetical protein
MSKQDKALDYLNYFFRSGSGGDITEAIIVAAIDALQVKLSCTIKDAEDYVWNWFRIGENDSSAYYRTHVNYEALEALVAIFPERLAGLLVHNDERVRSAVARSIRGEPIRKEEPCQVIGSLRNLHYDPLRVALKDVE